MSTVERQRFESFLLELATSFAQQDVNTDGTRIDCWLGKLAGLIGVERSTLWELSADGLCVVRRHSYVHRDFEHAPPIVPNRQFNWLHGQFLQGAVVAWSRVPEDIPEAASAERDYGLSIGAKSFLGIPIRASGGLCIITFTSMRRCRRWPEPLVQKLRLVGEILAGAVVRLRMEDSLSASESRIRAIVRAMPDLIFVLSPEGIYLDYQSRGDSELYRQPEEFLGRHVDDVLPPEAAAIFRNALLRASQTQDVVGVEYTLPIAGELREYEARCVRRDDGAILSIVRNISNRNRSARKLRESDERFRGAFESSAIGMALVSTEGRWLQVNPALCRMFGYTEDELTLMTFQQLTHPDDLARNLEQLRRAVEGEIDHYEFEKRYIHKDGHTIPALLTVSVVRDAARRPLYFVSQVQDLTERKRAEAESERLRMELALFGRLALTGQLTATLAHQLLQPITAVRANAEALVVTGEPRSAEAQATLEDILENCNRAADVINHVRSLLRKDPRPRRRVNVNRLVEEVLSVMHYQLSRHNVRLTARLSTDVPEINANSVELQQVILNLIMNSIEAMAQNAPSERQLEITTALRAHEVEITVQDRGPGVEREHLQRMFEPFFTTKPEGMGMGLAISADIVRSHNGRLWAENNPTAGITMHCTLPLES